MHRQPLYISQAAVLAQLNALWDGTAAGSGLWLMMSLGLSWSLKVFCLLAETIQEEGVGEEAQYYCVFLFTDTAHVCKYTDPIICKYKCLIMFVVVLCLC